MGADLREAKRVCKEDGTLFPAWCESSECPVGFQTALRLMSVFDKHGDKNVHAGIFQSGYVVLAEVQAAQAELDELRMAAATTKAHPGTPRHPIHPRLKRPALVYFNQVFLAPGSIASWGAPSGHPILAASTESALQLSFLQR